ncbi:helix-turn-helix domain-containing protein [Rhizobium etli]|uniref:helix-turn-helix domain-containing protein n=1 Tax=Rhizobium etli TaxID=29449 RepID=UPI0009D74178
MQIVRDWVERFNAQGPEGLLNVKAPGKRSKLNDDQRQELVVLWRRGRSRRSTALCAGG